MSPILILVIGIAIVIGLIVVVRANAFLALIVAAMVVSLLAPGDVADKMARVGAALGNTTGSIGIIIALAAIIGKCMMDSGAADRVVRFFLAILGEKRGGIALNASGYVLAIPVFFDTVFYLLVPLARSMFRRTKSNYLLYVMAIAAGGACTHTLVPPTPGPLATADALGVDVGVMIVLGIVVAIPATIMGMVYATWLNRRMPIEMRPLAGGMPEPQPLEEKHLPPLFWSLAPVVLPVLLISANTALTSWANAEHAARLTTSDIHDAAALRQALVAADAAAAASPARRMMEKLPKEAAELIRQGQGPAGPVAAADLLPGFASLLADRTFFDDKAFLGVTLPADGKKLLAADRNRLNSAEVERLNRFLLEASLPAHFAKHNWDTPRRQAADISAIVGNSSFALLLSTLIAMAVYKRQRKPTAQEMVHMVEGSLMSAGVIILITAAGGAFGAMLQAAKIGPAIQEMFTGDGGKAGSFTILFLAFTIAAVLKIAQGSSTVAMITTASMVNAMIVGVKLDFHPAYLATAIASGSLIISWMNDSGFWIYAKMSGLTEVEALKSWTVLLVVLGATGMAVTTLLAVVLPMAG